MRTFFLFIAVLGLVASLGSVLIAQETDEEAVSMVAERWAEAWNKADIKAIGELYTADAEYLAFTGETFEGREEIEKTFADLNATAYKGTQITLERTSVRIIEPNVAVYDNRWEVTGVPQPESGEPPPSKGLATVVAVKQDGQWLIASHCSRIPMTPPSTE